MQTSDKSNYLQKLASSRCSARACTAAAWIPLHGQWSALRGGIAGERTQQTSLDNDWHRHFTNQSSLLYPNLFASTRRGDERWRSHSPSCPPCTPSWYSLAPSLRVSYEDRGNEMPLNAHSLRNIPPCRTLQHHRLATCHVVSGCKAQRHTHILSVHTVYVTPLTLLLLRSCLHKWTHSTCVRVRAFVRCSSFCPLNGFRSDAPYNTGAARDLHLVVDRPHPLPSTGQQMAP